VGPEARAKDILDLAKGRAQLLTDPTVANFQLQMADTLLQVSCCCCCREHRELKDPALLHPGQGAMATPTPMP
jgi:hypothetical protein